jgi:hypothetical protein
MMKIKLGEFYPRPEHSWSQDLSRRCHTLGSRVVHLQAGLGLAQMAAKHGDATDIGMGIHHAQMAAEELVQGLPEHKALVGAVKNRAKMLDALMKPYRYGHAKLPKKVVQAVEAQVKAMESYAFKLEGESIKACGGQMTGAHVTYQNDKLQLPELPKGMLAAAKKLLVEQKKETELRAARQYKKSSAKWEKASKSREKAATKAAAKGKK